LPAAIVPVAIGAFVTGAHHVNGLNVLLCAVVALSLQIATNYANDYADGVRGTDAVRVGPFRLTASGLVGPRSVKNAAFIGFGVAACAGSALAARSSWWFVVIGATAIAAGWFYTGGPKPYGYMGLGEVFVMLYFGFVATVGTTFAAVHQIPRSSWWWGLCAGAMACALLEANNLRDIDGDQGSGKRTLAARLGRRRASWLYGACVAGAVIGALGGGVALVAAGALVLYIPALQVAFSPKTGRELLVLLQHSARTQLFVGAGAVVAFLVTR
jgi:1,4-dihydroxy-2-naphthoate octaprenyltransferase